MVANTESAHPAQLLKEKGNEFFKNQEWDKAIAIYTEAIKLTENETSDMATLFKNRAAAFLKNSDNENALKDCSAALDITPTDPKALFRRSQALEALGRFEEAYRDARGVLSSEPHNKLIQPILTRLHAIVQERARENAKTTTKVAQMFAIAFDISADKEKRELAMSNLLVLSRESAGSEVLFKEERLEFLKTIIII